MEEISSDDWLRDVCYYKTPNILLKAQCQNHSAGAKHFDWGAISCDEVSIVSPLKVRLVGRDNA